MAARALLRAYPLASSGWGGTSSERVGSGVGVANSAAMLVSDRQRRLPACHSSWASASTAPVRRNSAAGFGKIPTTSVRRLISLWRRSNGLVLQIFLQCASGKSANAVRSALASRSMPATAGNLLSSRAATVSTWSRTRRGGLGEDGADGGGDHLGVALAHLGERVAQEVDAASLPARALQHGRDRGGQPAVGVADDQLHAGEPALAQGPEELGPELFGLAVADGVAEHLATSVRGHAGGHHDGLRHDPAVDAHLAVGGVGEQVAEGALQRALRETRRPRRRAPRRSG